jgi:hypothetical protein
MLDARMVGWSTVDTWMLNTRTVDAQHAQRSMLGWQHSDGRMVDARCSDG